MDDACHGYIFFRHDGVHGDGGSAVIFRLEGNISVFPFFQFHRFAGEAHPITVCQIDIEVMVTVGGLV